MTDEVVRGSACSHEVRNLCAFGPFTALISAEYIPGSEAINRLCLSQIGFQESKILLCLFVTPEIAGRNEFIDQVYEEAETWTFDVRHSVTQPSNNATLISSRQGSTRG